MCTGARTPLLQSFRERIRTFYNWSRIQTPDALASAGFFRTPDAGADDVQCFYCGIRVFDWEDSDEPLSEHIRWSQNCKFAKLMQTLKQTKTLIKESSKLLNLLEEAAKFDSSSNNGVDVAGNNGGLNSKDSDDIKLIRLMTILGCNFKKF